MSCNFRANEDKFKILSFVSRVWAGNLSLSTINWVYICNNAFPKMFWVKPISAEFSVICRSRIAENCVSHELSLFRSTKPYWWTRKLIINVINTNFRQICHLWRIIPWVFCWKYGKIIFQKCQTGAIEKFNGVHTEQVE